MPKRLTVVRDQLVTDSRIACIGEAPGGEEEATGRPFVGPAGSELNRQLHVGGLRRDGVSVMNVVLRRPKDNDIKAIPRDELEAWQLDLRKRLTKLPYLKFIVPLGNTALEAVLGDRARLAQNKKLTISKAKGFYFTDVKLDDGRIVTVLPSYHPAATFRDTTLTKVCEHIWRRVGEEMRTGFGAESMEAAVFTDDGSGAGIPNTNGGALGPLIDDTYTYDLMPHPDDALDYARDVIRAGRPIAVDIETPKEPPRDKILVCGFSNDGRHSMIIPYHDHRGLKGFGKEGAEKFRHAIKLICESQLPKIGANLLFDAYELKWVAGIELNNVVYDVRTMDLCRDPRSEHDLGSITSWFHRCRYWKDKDEEAREADDYIEFARYNGLDNCHAWNDAQALKKELVRVGRFDAYMDVYKKRFYPLLRVMLHGTLVDQRAREEQYNVLIGECAGIRNELADIAEVRLEGENKDSKSLSRNKLISFLHGPKVPPVRPPKLTKTGKLAKNQPSPFPSGLELKPVFDKDTGKISTDEVALRKHRLKVEGKSQRAERALSLILDHRSKEQMSKFLKQDRVDKDNRFRCSFGFAGTGRLTSSENPYGTGGNSQNQQREIRHIYLPDPGCIWLSTDLSAAEDRLCKVYSKDAELIRLARTKPWEYDAHKDNASRIFQIPVDAVTKEQRQLGKVVVHGAQRMLGGQTMSDGLLKSGYVYAPQWCTDKIESYHRAFPAIRDGYWAWVFEELMSKEILVNPWGFAMTFYGERKDDSVKRDALSFLLQACCVFVLDLQGFIPLDFMIEHEQFPNTRINNEVHDAVYASTPLDEAYDVAEFLVSNLERPVSYDGVDLSIPSTLKIGSTQADEHSYEFKKFPSRDEFMRHAEKFFEDAEKRRKDAEGWTPSKEWLERQEAIRAKREATVYISKAEKERLKQEAKEAKAEARAIFREAMKAKREKERSAAREEKRAAKELAKALKASAAALKAATAITKTRRSRKRSDNPVPAAVEATQEPLEIAESLDLLPDSVLSVEETS